MTGTHVVDLVITDLGVFEIDKKGDGGMTLEKGKTWRFRYAVVVHPGDAASAGIAKLYKEYAR